MLLYPAQSGARCRVPRVYQELQTHDHYLEQRL